MLLRHFEAVAGQVNLLIRAHVFLRNTNLSAEKQSQIVSVAKSRYEYEPLRDAMLTAIPRAGALRGGAPLHRKQPGAYFVQVVEAEDEEDEGEHVTEGDEVSDDELEAGHQEAVADDNSKATKNGGGPSETVLSKPSIVWRPQGKARQAQTETSMCAVRATWPLE